MHNHFWGNQYFLPHQINETSGRLLIAATRLDNHVWDRNHLKFCLFCFFVKEKHVDLRNRSAQCTSKLWFFLFYFISIEKSNCVVVPPDYEEAPRGHRSPEAQTPVKIFIVCPNLFTYLIFVIFFTRAKFLENKIYTEKRKFFALNL